MIPGSRSPTVSRLSLLAATAAQRTSARPGSANNAARAPPPRVHFPCRPTATDARPYRQVRCRHRRPPSQAFAAPRRPPTAAAKRHRSAHPALTARQGSADNALSRHLWPTGQSAVDDLCGRGHEAPPPSRAPISFGAEQPHNESGESAHDGWTRRLRSTARRGPVRESHPCDRGRSCSAATSYASGMLARYSCLWWCRSAL